MGRFKNLRTLIEKLISILMRKFRELKSMKNKKKSTMKVKMVKNLTIG